MVPEYPGEMARRRCAKRTRAELLAYRPSRPLALRDALRLSGMQARCATCRACPKVVAALAAMAPAQSEAEPPVAAVLRLAS